MIKAPIIRDCHSDIVCVRYRLTIAGSRRADASAHGFKSLVVDDNDVDVDAVKRGSRY